MKRYRPSVGPPRYEETVKQGRLEGGEVDTFKTEAEHWGIRPKQGRLPMSDNQRPGEETVFPLDDASEDGDEEKPEKRYRWRVMAVAPEAVLELSREEVLELGERAIAAGTDTHHQIQAEAVRRLNDGRSVATFDRVTLTSLGSRLVEKGERIHQAAQG